MIDDSQITNRTHVTFREENCASGVLKDVVTGFRARILNDRISRDGSAVVSLESQ